MRGVPGVVVMGMVMRIVRGPETWLISQDPIVIRMQWVEW